MLCLHLGERDGCHVLEDEPFNSTFLISTGPSGSSRRRRRKAHLAPKRAKDTPPPDKVVGDPVMPAHTPVVLGQFGRVRILLAFSLCLLSDGLQGRNVESTTETLDEHLGRRRGDEVVEGGQVSIGRDEDPGCRGLCEDDPAVEFRFVERLKGYTCVSAVLEESMVEWCWAAKTNKVDGREVSGT